MRCPHCHQDSIPISTEVCPHCGVYLPSILRYVLPTGALLCQGIYRIDDLLGRGGFGITYQAFHTEFAKPVAIKEFYPQELAVRDTITGELKIIFPHQEAYERGLERFIREGRILKDLNHSNVVRVENLFQERGTAYLVMELLHGQTLEQELNAQPKRQLSPERIKQVMEPLVTALTAVHEKLVYHLDIKPANVLLSNDGRVVLIDFGAARQKVSSSSTQPYTPDYAAPEIIAGHDVGSESDIFELGMMLYEMLTGTLPAPALSRLLKDTWQPQRLEEPWQSLVNTALQIKKSERPSTVQEWWFVKNTHNCWDSWRTGITIPGKPSVHSNPGSNVPSNIGGNNNGSNVAPKIEPQNAQPANNSFPGINKDNKTTPGLLPKIISVPSNTEGYTSSKSVVLIGDRAVGKTSMVVALARGTKHVQFNSDPEGLIAKRSNPATGEIAGTSTMTAETLSVNVQLPAGGREIQFLWIDTPGEAFSSQNWRKNNQTNWQEIQQTILQTKGLILLLPPHQDLVEPHRLENQSIRDELPTHRDWLSRLENWLAFCQNCQQVEHILVCLHKADMFCDVNYEAKRWRFGSSRNPLWFEYDNYIRHTYFASADQIIREYNSHPHQGSLHFFITSIYQPSLLELPWIYLGTFLAHI